MDRGVARSFTTEERRRALTVLALCSDNARAAARQLKAQGHPVNARTLDRWRTAHADELEEVRQEVVVRIHARIAAEQEAVVREATQAAREYVERARHDLKAGKVKDAAGGARNLETVSGIGVDKLLVLRDRPTQVVEHRHAVEVLAELDRIFPKRYDADSGTQELPPAA